MTPAREGRFMVRYRQYVCPKCKTRIFGGNTAYRIGRSVYCKDCGDNWGRTPAPPTPEKPSPRRRPAAVPVPKGGGAMPGEKCATRDADGVWRYEFGSVGEAVADALDDYAQNAPCQEFLRSRLEYGLSGKDDWTNHMTRARFVRELSEPSKHLLEAVDRMRKHLVDDISAPTAPRRKVRRGQEFGDELDSDRWLTRSLTPWDRNVREQQTRRTVTIGCNLSVNANIRPEQLLARGAAALALADVLNTRGLNVGIVLFDSRSDPTDKVGRACFRHMVKSPLMPMDIGAIAFAMCEIGWFRIVMAVGGMRHFPGKHSEGLGSARPLPTADRRGLDYLIESDVFSEAEAIEWLKGCLAKQESEVSHV